MLPDLILVIWGEAENCSFEEKKWIGHVVLNRLKTPWKFRTIEQDFKGYTRNFKVTNRIEREAFKECVRAALIALIEDHFLAFDPSNGATFFCLKGSKNFSKFFAKLVEVSVPEEFKHYFFKLEE